MTTTLGTYDQTTKQWIDQPEETAVTLLVSRIVEHERHQREQVQSNPPLPPEVYCKGGN